MKFKLFIDCDNDAFQENRGEEVAGLLNNVAQVLIVDGWAAGGILHDRNGNRVGSWKFTEE